jgi:hypothetical protein
MVVTG